MVAPRKIIRDRLKVAIQYHVEVTMAEIKYSIKLRRDVAANWTANNPVLADGEVGIEKDTNKVKLGDGSTSWNLLSYGLGEAPPSAAEVSFTPSGNISAVTTQLAIQELDSEKAKTTDIRTAGTVVKPSFQDNGDGSVTIGSGTYMLYSNTGYSGTPVEYVIAGGTYSLTDNSANYILADYNNGNPHLIVITAVPPPSTTDSDKVPIFSCYRSGNDIHYFDWDHLALGLAEKLNQRVRRTDRFHIDNGLGLSETPTRVINIASGAVWAGANLIDLAAIDSSSPETHFYYHTAGSWVRSTLSQYNNTQYDNGTNLVTLTNNKYAVNWVYRSVQPTGAIYVILGSGDYSLIEAQASVEPSKPVEVSTQAVLIGRIIVLKGATTSTQIDRVSNVTFGTAAIVNHNDLSSIQGGLLDQYYHLSATEYSRLATPSVRSTAISSAITNTDVTVYVTATGTTQTLPLASTFIIGQTVTVKLGVDGVVTLPTSGSDVIDGESVVYVGGNRVSLDIRCINSTTWSIV